MITSVFSLVANLTLIISYSAVLAFVLCLYMLRRDRQILTVIGLFSVYLLDTIVVYMTEVIPAFSVWYNTMFMSVPTIKTIIYLISALFTVQIWNHFFNRVFSLWQGVILILMGLWYMFIPMMENSALKVWLYYIIYQIFTLVFSISALLLIKRQCDNTAKVERIFKMVLVVTAVFSALIAIEDYIVIFNVDIYSMNRIYIQDCNHCENVLRMFYAAVILGRILHHTKGCPPFAGENAETPVLHVASVVYGVPEEQHIEEYKKIKFGQGIGLTDREREVLNLLLDNQNNQEICQGLSISVGTVKAHVHNIYRKANVTNRQELLDQYLTFSFEHSA